MHDQSLFIREKHPFTLTLSRPSFLAQSWNRLAGKQGRASFSESASQRKTGSPGLTLSCVCLWCYLWQNRWALTTEVLSSGWLFCTCKLKYPESYFYWWYCPHPKCDGYSHHIWALLQGPKHCGCYRSHLQTNPYCFFLV